MTFEVHSVDNALTVISAPLIEQVEADWFCIDLQIEGCVLWRNLYVPFLFCVYLQSVSVSALDGVSLAAEAAGIVRLEPAQHPTPTITIRVRDARLH